MKKPLKTVVALIILGAAGIGAIVFAALHYGAGDALGRVDHLWLKILLSFLSVMLTAILGIELYGLFYYPSARRLILRGIGFVTTVGCSLGVAPLGWFTLQSAEADLAKGRLSISLGQAAGASAGIALLVFGMILILTKWYIDLLKWEQKENGGKVLE